MSTTTDRAPLAELDAASVRRWAAMLRAALGAARKRIDALNVFPVPDGDTGTNLYLTVEGALEHLIADEAQTGEGTGEQAHAAGGGAGEILQRWARALQWSARGNSGVILSQLALGLAQGAHGSSAIGVVQLRDGVVRASDLAWAAVSDPQDGTILSVARAAAQVASSWPEADSGDGAEAGSLHALIVALRDAAWSALLATEHQLEALRNAGVVDAGGAGLYVVLHCLERVCAQAGLRTVLEVGLPERSADAFAVEATGVAGAAPAPEYEVMYLLGDADEAAASTLRDTLAGLGDSVLVVGATPDWTVHAHVDDAGAAIEAGVELGRPRRIRIERLERARLDAHPVLTRGHAAGDAPPHPAEPRPAAQAGLDAPPRPGQAQVPSPPGSRARTGLVACVAGAGLDVLFQSQGAVTVDSGPGRRASTGALIDAVRAAHRRSRSAEGGIDVVLLPNDADTRMSAAVAVDAVAQEGIRAAVVGSRTAVQGVAALAVFDPSAPLAANVVAMQEAASATRHGGITIANRDALTSGGVCRIGDVLGVVDGDIVIVGHDQATVAEQVVTRLLSSGGELLTLLTGEGASDAVIAQVEHAVAQTRPDVEVVRLDGQQDVYPLLIGVE